MALRPTHLALFVTLVIAAAVGGCIEPAQTVIPSDAQGDTVVSPDGGRPDAVVVTDSDSQDATLRPACDPPLSLAPRELWLGPGQEGSFNVEGGSGSGDRTLTAPDGSPLEVTAEGRVTHDGTVGEYQVTLQDPTCQGEATATIRVVPALSIEPRTAVVPPGVTLRFEVQGGSGDVALELQNLEGYGYRPEHLEVFDDGRLVVAEDADGQGATVVARDVKTGLEVSAVVTMDEAARLSFVPPVVYLPVGAATRVRTTGGSVGGTIGWVPTLASGDCSLEGDVLKRLAGEDGTPCVVRAEDPLTGEQAELNAFGMAPLEHTLRAGPMPAGMRPTLLTGDLNGDAFPDVVLAQPGATGRRASSGVILVFHGTQNGVGTQAAQRIEGTFANGQLGEGVALADLTGDGKLDLVAGEPGADTDSGTDAGRLLLFVNDGSGAFDLANPRVLAGTKAGARFGTQVAACDTNGQGSAHVLVTAPDAFDPLVRTTPGQGALFVFTREQLASGAGSTPAATHWGLVRSNGGWTSPSAERLRFGMTMAIGDLDDDDVCDVAVGAPDAFSDLGEKEVFGRVHVYRGPTLLQPDPVDPTAFIESNEAEARLGAALAMGDLDGDGRDELAVGSPGADNTGAVEVYRIPSLELAEDLLDAPMLPWRVKYGSADRQAYGVALTFGEVNSDGREDLLVGAPQTLGGLSGARHGGIHSWSVTDPAELFFEAGPTFAGQSSEQLGTAVAVSGQRLYALANASDIGGLDTTALVVIPLQGSAARQTVSLANRPPPAEIGQSVLAVHDGFGEGRPAMIVGVPNDTVPTLGNDHLGGGGMVVISSLDDAAGGMRQSIGLFPGHDRGDRFGQAMTLLDDFNGDQSPELAIAARFDGWTNAASWSGPGACQHLSGRRGAVLLFNRTAGPAPWVSRPYLGLFSGLSDWGVEGVTDVGDLNGDGFSDLVVTAPRAAVDRLADVGGVEIWFGVDEAASTTASRALCTPGATMYGEGAGDRAGHLVVRLGDMDDDGRDDFAIAIPGGGPNDHGAIAIVRMKSDGGAITPDALVIEAPTGADAFGEGLVAADVNGDDTLDIIVGAPEAGGGGAVWVVDGRGLAAGVEAWEDSSRTTRTIEFSWLEGWTTRFDAPAGLSRFGSPVVVVASSTDGLPLLGVGAVTPSDDVLASTRVVGLFAVSSGLPGGGFDLRWVAALLTGKSSESFSTDLRLAPWSTDSGRGLLVGVPRSDALSPESGAAFPVGLDAVDRLNPSDD